MGRLNVDFIEYFSAATYRHLNMHSSEKIKVYMLPSEDGIFAIEKGRKEQLKSIDFKIKNHGVISFFKLLMSQNSKCSSLLSPEFISGLIWAIDPTQDYAQIEELTVKEESISYVFHIEIDGYSDESIILNVTEA